MVKSVTLRKIGGSIGATGPKELADRFRFDLRDRVFVVPLERVLLLTPYDPPLGMALSSCRRGAKKSRNALRELANYPQAPLLIRE
jgi:hypothetical protein